MNRSKLARLAALAISYQNVNKPQASAFFMSLYLVELGIPVELVAEGGLCPAKYATEFGMAEREVIEGQFRLIKGEVA